MIITDETILRVPCEDVRPEEVGELRDLLERELINSARLGRPGIGLAAPQVGIHKKMAIIRVGETKFDMVNSYLVKGYDEFIHRDEGCLSFPDRVENVNRYNEVHIAGNLIFPHSAILTGLIGVIWQHEADHYNGILLPDRAIPKPPTITNKTKIGPNERCFCNSGLKYKRCCGK